MSKPWDRERENVRREETRLIRDRILIVCEGEKTEPNYFRKFPVQIDLVELNVTGIGANTLSLVKETIRYRDEAVRKRKPYNQVWCVFDRDEFPAANFKEAFRLANAQGVRVAYSNQCFELWYMLHFCFNDAALHRHAYGKKLTEFMGRKYLKNDEKMYNDLKDRQWTAMQNARKLLNRYSPCNSEGDDPSTTVHLLVEILNEFIPGKDD